MVASGPSSMRAATLLLVAGVALAGDTPTLAGGVALAGDTPTLPPLRDTPTLPPPRSEHGAALLWRLHSLCGGLGIALNTFVLWMFVRKGTVVIHRLSGSICLNCKCKLLKKQTRQVQFTIQLVQKYFGAGF